MKNDDFVKIYGRNPVEESLSADPSSVEKIFIRKSLKVSSYFDIRRLAKDNSIPLVLVPEEKIFSLVGDVNDQGIVALISPVQYLDYYEWAESLHINDATGVLLLQGIEDPHNFGAILRTAAAAGMDAVIVPTQHQSPITPAVMKSSAGTAGKIPIIRVHDLNQALKDLSLTGFSVHALDGKGSETIWETGINGPSAFLIGNEGKGIPDDILKKCTSVISIPMSNEVESLNASVSASVVCFEWRRRHTVQ
ncbi:23S rRNA (guanosine(2251)-2'-O)-methyltransferase RlmB [Balneola sp. MJW-20]|uniref:23S rRNA (guanosine(2251)-2'-O)-methyltransferase RlmB n=1 Tax=Gracilimonas aurantiaca TaxID=3234185 RepID=UPI0034650A92